MTREEMARQLGRRVSRGEFERSTRVYDVHQCKDYLGRPGYRNVRYRDLDGTIKDGVMLKLTHVLNPDCRKASRKVSMSDRTAPRGPRARYLVEPITRTI
jgi:hypothetical protein